MCDYHFISDLDIKPSNTLFDSQSEEELSAEIKELKEQMLQLSRMIESKQETLQKLQENRKSQEQSNIEIQLGTPSISKDYSLYDKAAFLYELFHARRDVCAGRWFNKKTQIKSYSPRCLNSLHPNCPRNQYYRNGRKGLKPDCSGCTMKLYEHLTPNLIMNKQLLNKNEQGHDAIGLYAMLPGNVCRFLAIDFDEKTWKQDAITVSNVARRAGFQIAIERSYSGNGAHLWLFFSEDVPAWKARKLAFSFLDQACEVSKTVSLKSYDRVFPSQDKIEKDGLGNLILMPLLLSAANRPEPKGTVFIDNDFNTYPDQLLFLSALPKYTNHQIDLYLLQTSQEKTDWFGTIPNDEMDVLWNRRLPKISNQDVVSNPLPIFLSSGISIPKNSMSPKLQNALKKMTCFSNPEYYKSMNRNKGYAPQTISSIVWTFIESDTVLQLPRGLISHLKSYLSESDIKYSITDKRTANTKLEVVFKGKLRDEQIPAVKELLKHECGILRAATSFGKTAVAAKMIAERKEKTLILVPKNDLLTQWEKSLNELLTVETPPVKREGKRLNKTGIGLLGGNRDSVSGLIDVATFQTVASRMPEFIKDYGMVIVDECHHVAADSFEKVMQAVKSLYIYGLSATVKRVDGLEKVVYAQCGNVVFEYKAAELAQKRGITQFVIPRFTNATASIMLFQKYNHSEIINEITKNDLRNRLIVSDVTDLVSKGRRVLILSDRVEHTLALQLLIEEKGIESVAISGQTTGQDLKVARQKIDDRINKCPVIISTGQYLGEGTDIPYLDTLVLATPISWEGKLSQYAGRIARSYEDKTNIYIYDYVDFSVPQLDRMYAKRLSTYKKLGFLINGSPTDDIPGLYSGKTLYSALDILNPFVFSIRNANHRIIISSPEIFLSRATKQIVEELKEASKKNVEISVITHSEKTAFNTEAQETAIQFMKENGINVHLKDTSNLRFAVIDSSEVWFGYLNLLGGSLGKDYKDADQKVMMHISNPHVAKTLIESEYELF